jgi:hypothetical protein
MKVSLLAFFALSFSSIAAFAHPDSTKMTCVVAQAYIQQNGTAVLGTCGEFANFSANGCGYGQMARPGYVRTSDSATCYVGSYCVAYHQGGAPAYIQDGGDTCN